MLHQLFPSTLPKDQKINALICVVVFSILYDKKGKHLRNICLHMIYLITIYGARLFHMSGVDSLYHKLPAVLDVYMTSLWLLSRTRWWRPQLNLVFFDLKAQPLMLNSCSVKCLLRVETLKSKVREATVQALAWGCSFVHYRQKSCSFTAGHCLTCRRG